MSLLQYNPTQLQLLSTEELQRIIRENEWPPLTGQATREQIIAYIINRQRGYTQPSDTKIFSAGLTTSPVVQSLQLLQEYYSLRDQITTQLSALNDATLFAVVDSLGEDLVITARGIRVNDQEFPDRVSLLWWLLALRTAR